MEQRIYDAVQANPIIAAVKNEQGLCRCLSSDCQVVFVLYGDICTVADIVARIKAAGKLAFVHTDLIVGLAQREVAMDFIRQNTAADGVITTRPNLIARARQLSLCTVLRLFMLDSMALREVDTLCSVRPDFLELLPGCMPKVIRRIKARTGVPLLAGGLICDKEDVMEALSAGAMAISTTDEGVWQL